VTRNNSLIFGAMTALACCNIAFGMTVQLIPLVMDAEGDSKTLIGLNTTVGQFGVLLTGFALPWLTQRFGSHRLVLFASAMLVASLAGFALLQPRWGWFVVRFLSGICISMLFTTSETWIQAAAGDNSRGRLMSIYMSVLTLSFGAGPFLIPLTGFQGPAPWIVGMATMALGLVVMSLLKVEELPAHSKTGGFLAPALKAPLIFICIGATTLFEGIMLSFFTLYAIANGMKLNEAAGLLGFGIAASLIFFFPIGWLADHWSRRGMVWICAIVALAGSLLQILAISTLAIWPLIVLLRAGAFGTYLNGFAMLGDRFKGVELMTAAAFVSILWGIGGVIGPPLAGLAIDHIGIGTLPYIMAVCYVPVLLALAGTSQSMRSS